jgi:hypothetical protein
MEIAQAIEKRNCIQAEIDLASRRFRHLIYATHAQALRAERLSTEHATASQQVFKSVRTVIESSSDVSKGKILILTTLAHSNQNFIGASSERDVQNETIHPHQVAISLSSSTAVHI